MSMVGKMLIPNGSFLHVIYFTNFVVLPLFFILAFIITVSVKSLWIIGQNHVKSLTIIGTIILNLTSLIIFYRKNPGIASNGLPHLN